MKIVFLQLLILLNLLSQNNSSEIENNLNLYSHLDSKKNGTKINIYFLDLNENIEPKLLIFELYINKKNSKVIKIKKIINKIIKKTENNNILYQNNIYYNDSNFTNNIIDKNKYVIIDKKYITLSNLERLKIIDSLYNNFIFNVESVNPNHMYNDKYVYIREFAPKIPGNLILSFLIIDIKSKEIKNIIYKISYNLKDYKIKKIKRDEIIIISEPNNNYIFFNNTKYYNNLNYSFNKDKILKKLKLILGDEFFIGNNKTKFKILDRLYNVSMGTFKCTTPY